MDWSDEGIILSARRHGEGSIILEALTRGHGRHLGLVRGGASQRMSPVLQVGNTVLLTWRARLAEHLGNYTVESGRSRAAGFLDDRRALAGLGTLSALARLLPERDPHPALHTAMNVVLDHLHEPVLAGALLVRFELALLGELGFGLDLSACAATGRRERLVYVSPRSGRAVSEAAGAPWRGKLLALPGFLSDAGRGAAAEGIARALPTTDEIAAGFLLTGHFLARHVFEPRGIAAPEMRARFIAGFVAAGAPASL